MAYNVHKITEIFEQELCEYTSSPYCCVVDSCSNALWLSMMYENVNGKEVHIPKHTYVSLPNEIILAGGKVKFYDNEPILTGKYQLSPFPIYDSALSFSGDMYKELEGNHVCLSFTGAYKHLKLGKGGAILTDNKEAWEWFKKARNSGRNDCSYHMDNFKIISRKCYLHPMIATLGIQLLQQFYNLNGSKKTMEDASLPYPDLSKFEIFKQHGMS